MDILKHHLPPLVKLALPMIGAQLGMMLMGVVDTVMVGHFSVEALAAASIGSAFFFTVLWIGVGLVQGIDPFVTQAHGARESEHAQLALQRGVVVALAVSVPQILTLVAIEKILLLFGQSPHLARLARDYIYTQLWSLPLFLLFMAIRQYFQGREIVKPLLWVVAIANVANVMGNYVLIYGNLGAPSLGLVGAGIASAIARALMFVTLLIWALGQSQVDFAWIPWRRSVYNAREFIRILRVGIQVSAQIGLEVMAFNTGVLVAGLLGEVALGAHSIALNLGSLAFMVPLGISQAAVTRVGNLIGARQFREANRAAWVAIVFGGLVMVFSATLLVLFHGQLPALYADDHAVIAMAAGILPIVAAFQIFDGIQVVCSGILRGMGRPLPSVVANLVAYWFIGLPIGYWTAIELGFGLHAIWWSFVLGLCIVATMLVTWIALRGPDKHARQVERELVV